VSLPNSEAISNHYVLTKMKAMWNCASHVQSQMFCVEMISWAVFFNSSFNDWLRHYICKSIAAPSLYCEDLKILSFVLLWIEYRWPSNFWLYRNLFCAKIWWTFVTNRVINLWKKGSSQQWKQSLVALFISAVFLPYFCDHPTEARKWFGANQVK